jgi:hypothetical protein
MTAIMVGQFLVTARIATGHTQDDMPRHSTGITKVPYRPYTAQVRRQMRQNHRRLTLTKHLLLILLLLMLLMMLLWR